MPPSRRVLLVALGCLSNLCLSNFCLSSFAAAQQSDQVSAERVLGPQWRQLSRRAGMIFAGTVLTAPTQGATDHSAATDQAVPPAFSRATPAVQLSFRVDRAIAGVEQGQILTIHEWAGAWSMHRPMRSGQHILIFLYPLSRLGFTSPVSGARGQVALDSSGKNVAKSESSQPLVPADTRSVSVVQLERAIRSARNEEE